MPRYVAPEFLKRTRSHSRFVLAGLILVLAWASSIGAQEQPILRFGGRVTYVSPQEMLVALDSGGVVMLDLVRISQSETHQIAQNDYVTVIGSSDARAIGSLPRPSNGPARGFRQLHRGRHSLPDRARGGPEDARVVRDHGTVPRGKVRP